MKKMQRLRLYSLGLLLGFGGSPTVSLARSLDATVNLGRDANGQPCTGTLGWSVGTGSTFFQEDQSYNILCRGVAAARAQGYVEVPSKAVPASGDRPYCGAASTLTIARVGQVEVRRCVDPRIQATAIDVRVTRADGVYHAVAVETAIAPMEALLRALMFGGDTPGRDDRVAATLDVSQLAAAPEAPVAVNAADTGTAGFTAQNAIARGLDYIRSGRRVEASRLLNDAISEFVDASALARAELRMTAGLADSNISQFEAAAEHFTAARGLLAQEPQSEVKSTLETKLGVYAALDATNRKAWAEALRTLDIRQGAGFPFVDPVILSEINQGPKKVDPSTAVSVANVAQLERLVLDAEANRARSLSYLALGRVDQSRVALARAVQSVRNLQSSKVRPGSIAWLRAAVERQRARIEEYARNRELAIGSLDCAIATMQNTPLPASPACLFEGPAGALGVSAVSATVIAEAQLERARLTGAQLGVDQAVLLNEYDAAVDTLTTDGGANGAAPLALAGYLDMLVRVAATNPSAAIDEKFFKALQSAGEPAVAREVVRLQSVVGSDPAIQALMADRTEYERQVVRLRYEIQAVPAGDAAALERLTADQRSAQNALNDINAKLAPTLIPVDEKPVTVADLRGMLKPGEVYLKLASLNNATYAAAISTDKMAIYRVAQSTADLQALTGQVLRSARSFVAPSGQLSLRVFSVEKSHQLFLQVAGPAASMLTEARSVTYDPVGELRNLPAALLVTAPDVVQKGRTARTDYSQVAFLARKADIATALSPRSFMVTRSKVTQSAPKPFLGLGETVYAPELGGAAGARQVRLAPGCQVSYANWAEAYNSNEPISAREISLSAAALGIGTAPMITGAEFSDANIERASASGELSQYQILHFATHGLTAQPFGAPGCESGLPPSLLTSLVPGSSDGPVVSNGLLSFDQVAGLRLNANLVFLSACETATGVTETAGRLTGQEDSTPSLDGLVRAFLAANARTVVATLWSVPVGDDTDSLIETFYRQGRDNSISTALREAQLQLINKPTTSHPYFWAAYFVVGDGSKQMLGDGAAMAAARQPVLAAK